MRFKIKTKTVRLLGLAGISALALILVAAGVELDQNWIRLRQLPREQRLKLIENLQRFDLVFPPAKQQSLRDLDRQISELPPAQQAQYFAALRRYFNWLNHLPEARRGELIDAVPAERMPTVLKMISGNNPVPKVDTGKFLQFGDIGEFSPFELAAVFKIWTELTPDQKQGVEKKANDPQRLAEIFRLGRTKGLDREIRPADFDEEEWLAKTETYIREKRPGLALDDLKNKVDPRHAQILQRQSINFYFLDRKQEPVNLDRLASFVTAFPPFIQASFEQYPPDEARRRLTIVYRLVFPPGQELKPAAAASVHRPSARSAPAAPRSDSKSTTTGKTGAGGSPF